MAGRGRRERVRGPRGAMGGVFPVVKKRRWFFLPRLPPVTAAAPPQPCDVLLLVGPPPLPPRAPLPPPLPPMPRRRHTIGPSAALRGSRRRDPSQVGAQTLQRMSTGPRHLCFRENGHGRCPQPGQPVPHVSPCDANHGRCSRPFLFPGSSPRVESHSSSNSDARKEPTS